MVVEAVRQILIDRQFVAVFRSRHDVRNAHPYTLAFHAKLIRRKCHPFRRHFAVAPAPFARIDACRQTANAEHIFIAAKIKLFYRHGL